MVYSRVGLVELAQVHQKTLRITATLHTKLSSIFVVLKRRIGNSIFQEVHLKSLECLRCQYSTFSRWVLDLQ